MVQQFFCHNQQAAWLAQSVERLTLNREAIKRLRVRPPRRACPIFFFFFQI
ncbi:uncharacterized protein PRCAT00005441001 [Priceomyces carsonii]|uniref:uncharacterized protein n=1 Tax=Priceomyces carsonii TaxID=28549 RepID=UPI002ED94BB2|nr:unnamed protein product [Priceomyces carsonii]